MMQAIKRNRNLCLLIVLVLLSMGGGFFLFKNIPQNDERVIVPLSKEEGYFVPLEILGYGRGNTPYLDVIIGNKTIPAEIDLGYSGMFSLPTDLIKDIAEKKWVDRRRSWGLRGKIYENDVYKVKNMEIQGMFFFPVHISEQNLESMREGILSGTPHPEEGLFGTIGCELFSIFNLLVDCKHNTLALCDSVETLKQEGYPVDSFIEAKLLSNSGIAFEALTEAGPLCCLLDTGTTINMLNINLENGCNDHRILTTFDNDLSLLNPENKDLLIFNHKDTEGFSSFKIGGKEFGPLSFYRIKSPIQFDAILGMEFIESTLIFIDFEKEKIFFFPTQMRKERRNSMLGVKVALKKSGRVVLSLSKSADIPREMCLM